MGRMVYLNNVQILNYVLKSGDIASEIIEKLSSESIQQKLMAMSFLNELTILCKSMKL